MLEDMNKASVNYSIPIPDNLPRSSIGNLDDCLELDENEPKLSLMGRLDILRDKIPLYNKSGRLLKRKKICAIKIFPGHDPIYPTDKRLNPIYEICTKNNKPIVIHTGWNSNHPEVAKYNDPKYIVKVSQKFPNLKIVIAHYFWPKVDYCFEMTKDYENIFFDTSGLGDEEVVEETEYKKIKSVLEKTLKLNSKRVLFGTDYGMCSVKDHKKLTEDLDISNEVKQKVYWKNAVNIFGLEI